MGCRKRKVSITANKKFEVKKVKTWPGSASQFIEEGSYRGGAREKNLKTKSRHICIEYYLLHCTDYLKIAVGPTLFLFVSNVVM